ncbi:MAG TPA: hypothetical protein VNM16_12985 [Bacillota bacterium]|nr:hypothetical protein [Bacillota bacterium]
MYNYPSFPLDMDNAYFAAFRGSAPAAGDPAPDGTVTVLATSVRRHLSDFWRDGPLVIEFGSFT